MTSTTKNPVPAAYRNQIPHFKHDWDCCHFLGNYKDADTNEAMDLYVHTSGQCPTVIARIGSDGPDYMSGLGFSYGSIEPLVQARMRAQAAGLLKYNLDEALGHASPGFIESYEELQAAIPSTREYQAYRTFISGDVEKSRSLVNALVDEAFEDEKQYKEGAIRMACSFKVTNRLDKMLQVMCGMNPLESMHAAGAVTEFVWKNARPSSLLPTPSMWKNTMIEQSHYSHLNVLQGLNRQIQSIVENARAMTSAGTDNDEAWGAAYDLVFSPALCRRVHATLR